MHTSPRLLLDSLKRCPLCEVVNAGSSPACFVCGWAGEFERDPESLQASVDSLMAQCPDLAPERKRSPLLVFARVLAAKLRRLASRRE